MELDDIEGKLRRVRNDVEARKYAGKNNFNRPLSLNLTTLYCNDSPITQSSPLIATSDYGTGTPVPSVASNSTTSTTTPLIMVRHRPLSPPAAGAAAAALHRMSAGAALQGHHARRPIYRPASTANSVQLRHKQQQHKTTCCDRIWGFISELAWFLLGLRHLFGEVPLIVYLAWHETYVFHFYFTVACLVAPGIVALPYAIRSSSKSRVHHFVKCIALPLRLESFLRIFELIVPSWRGAKPWPAKLALMQAALGSAPQLLSQAAAMGWCSKPRPILYSDIQVFHGSSSTPTEELPTCIFPLLVLGTTTLIIAVFHVSWALAYISRLKDDRVNMELDPRLYKLLQRTSLLIGVTANLLLVGSRAALVAAAKVVGWKNYHVAFTCLVWLAVRISLDFILCMCKKQKFNIYSALISLVALDLDTEKARVLAKRCLMITIQNTMLIVAIATRAYGVVEASYAYRVSIINTAISLLGMLLLAARFKWVHITAETPHPSEGGKCLTKRTEPEVLE